MRLGISSYTYSWAIGVAGHAPPRAIDEHGLIDRCHEHGLKLLQFGDNLPLESFDHIRLERLAARARSEGVELEIGARRLTVERLALYAAIARQVGARLIRFVIDDADFHPTPDVVMATLRKAGGTLEGLTLAIENHDRLPAAVLRSMIEGTGSDQIGVCLDTVNSLGAGEGLETVVAALAPLTVNWHIKDFHIARVPHLMGFRVEGRPAGQGFLDVPGLLQKLAVFERCHTAVIESWTPREPRIEDTIAREAAWAGQSVEYLKPFFRQPDP
jgi:sugar phosphate isomerase/epimerase